VSRRAFLTSPGAGSGPTEVRELTKVRELASIADELRQDVRHFRQDVRHFHSMLLVHGVLILIELVLALFPL